MVDKKLSKKAKLANQLRRKFRRQVFENVDELSNREVIRRFRPITKKKKVKRQVRRK